MIDFAKVRFNDPEDENNFIEGKYENYQKKWIESFDNLYDIFVKYLEEMNKEGADRDDGNKSDDCAFESIVE